jgi:O-antigen ligase
LAFAIRFFGRQGAFGILPFLIWVLVTLLAFFCIGYFLWLALAIGVFGGIGLGIYLWMRVEEIPTQRENVPFPPILLNKILRYELFLIGPAILVLLFANHFPVFSLKMALGWVVFLGFSHRFFNASQSSSMPLFLTFHFLLSSSVSSFMIADNMRPSGNALCGLIAGIAFSTSLHFFLDSKEKISRSFGLFLVAGLGISLAGVLAMKIPQAKILVISSVLKYLPDVLPHRIHPNYLGGVLTFLVPAAFWGVVFGFWNRIGMGIILVVTGIVLLLTQSRSSMLGSALGIIISSFWAFPQLRRKITWRKIVGAGLFVVLAVLFVYRGGDEELKGSLDSRMELWQTAGMMTKDFPLTGVGLRAFRMVLFYSYPVSLTQIGTDGTIHPHNLYLDIAATIGLPGMVAFCALLGTWASMMLDVLKRSQGHKDEGYYKMIVISLGSGMMAHLIFNLTDTISLGEKAGLVFWGVLGISGATWNLVRTELARDQIGT